MSPSAARSAAVVGEPSSLRRASPASACMPRSRRPASAAMAASSTATSSGSRSPIHIAGFLLSSRRTLRPCGAFSTGSTPVIERSPRTLRRPHAGAGNRGLQDEVFMSTVTLDPLELAALLCSRVCHDVISPVGAIGNGLEVLEDEKDPAMRDFALDLIRKSARQASGRLKFARLAFGAAGSAGASIDLADAEQAARGLLQDDKMTLTWSAPPALLPKNKVKLVLNL